MSDFAAKPGSFLWLVLSDLRLNWRRFAGMLGEAGRIPPYVIAAIAIAMVHLIAWPVAKGLVPIADAYMGGGASPHALVAVLLAMVCWMIAQSMFGAMRTLYDRGDLDLLIGSPLPARRIFAAKAAAIAASSAGSIGILVLPLANMGPLVGRPQWLCAYPVLAALSLIATGVAVLVAIGLFFLCGARRARVVMQLTGAAIGGGFVLGAQVVMLLPEALREAVGNFLSPVVGPESMLGPVLHLPATALLGDQAAIAVLVLSATGIFAGAVLLLAEQFAKASLAAAGHSAGGSAKASSARRRRFRTHPGPALRRKEWRLLLRDSGLFAQVSLQIIYTLPMMLVLVKSNTVPAVVAIAPSLVVIVAQVAASLAWITVSGEDAPELIASAPVMPAAVDAAKLGAIAVPVAVLLVGPAALLAQVSPKAALLVVGLGVGASLSTALLNIWHPMPGNRRGMLRRHSQSKLLAVIEHVIAMLWAVAVVLALMGSRTFAMPIVLALAVLALAVPGSRKRLIGVANWLRGATKARAARAPGQV